MKIKLSRLGPGLLFAGAAIGVSHLVQSTRAGADFGWGLLWALLLINFLNTLFFSMAQDMPKLQVKLYWMDITNLEKDIYGHIFL